MKIEELKATLQEINVIDLVRNDKGNEKRDRYMDLQRSLKRPDAFESLSDEMVRDIRTFAKRFPHDHLKVRLGAALPVLTSDLDANTSSLAFLSTRAARGPLLPTRLPPSARSSTRLEAS
jgi:hypothetical protein